MQNRPKRSQPGVRVETRITSAIGREETEGRRRARSISFFTHTVLWLTGLLCLALLLGSLAQAWSNSGLMQQLDQEKQKYAQLQQEHETLKKQVDYYTDPKVIEQEARNIGYVKPGEQPVILVNEKETPPAQVKPEEQQQPARGFWEEWWRIFFGG